MRALVLHYDEDLDRITAVTGQASAWVVPRGSVDARAQQEAPPTH